MSGRKSGEAAVEEFREHHFAAVLLERIGVVGDDGLAPVGLFGDDRDLLVAALGHPVGVVGAFLGLRRDVAELPVGDFRIVGMRGCLRKLRHAGFLVHLRRGHRHARREVAEHAHDRLVVDEFSGDRHAFLRVGARVFVHDLDLERLVGAVESRQRDFGGVAEVLPVLRGVAGQRQLIAELHGRLVLRLRGAGGQREGGGEK